MYELIQPYDMSECEENKKPITLRGLEYKYDPDFIFIEQNYMRYKNDCKKTPVIYHHREYTHFPDMVDPDILLFGYPCREEVFNYYYPYEYYQIPIIDNLWNGVDMDYFKPKKKVFKGLLDIGWQLKYWQFAEVNGIFARSVIREQERFSKWADKHGLTKRFKPPIGLDKYRELLMGAEAILIDGGTYGWLTRRVFEAAACKTIMVIRVYNKEQFEFYKNIGLKAGKNYIPLANPYEVEEIDLDGKEVLAENAYEWVKDHTYEKRAKELIKQYERIFY